MACPQVHDTTCEQAMMRFCLINNIAIDAVISNC